MDQQEQPQRSSLSTPIMVGAMAAGILAVVFIVAIVRGGGGAGLPAPDRTGPQAEPAASGERPAPEPGTVSPLSPRKIAPKEGLTFTWAAGEGIEECSIIIYDNLMKKVWSSPRVPGGSVEPPEKILEYLKAGAPYRWKVIGYSSSGARVESESVPFRLVEPAAAP